MKSYVDENTTGTDINVRIVDVVAPDENVKKSKEENGGNAWKVKQAGIYPISYDKLREGQKDIDYDTLIAEENTIEKEKMPGFKRHPNYTNKEVREMREAAEAEAEARESNKQ